MGSDKTELVLRLKGSIEEAVHELQRVLLVLKHPAAVDSAKVEVEVSRILAALNKPLNLEGLLGEQLREVNDLHGVDRDFLPVPLHGLRDFS